MRLIGWRSCQKDMCETTVLTELLKGEEAYVLGCREEVAQGSYMAWVQVKVTEKYIDTSESVGLGKLGLARGMSQLALWASAVKGLDSNKTLSWRFWSRLLTDTHRESPYEPQVERHGKQRQQPHI